MQILSKSQIMSLLANKMCNLNLMNGINFMLCKSVFNQITVIHTKKMPLGQQIPLMHWYSVSRVDYSFFKWISSVEEVSD
jgi:hypothetical protein